MAVSRASESGRRSASMAASSRPGSEEETERNASRTGPSANGKRSATNAPNRAASGSRVRTGARDSTMRSMG